MYREFRRKHPEWPKKIHDAVGRRVRLRESLVTRGGKVFNKGEKLIVCSTYRGGLALSDVENAETRVVGSVRFIRDVRPYQLELLP